MREDKKAASFGHVSFERKSFLDLNLPFGRSRATSRSGDQSRDIRVHRHARAANRGAAVRVATAGGF